MANTFSLHVFLIPTWYVNSYNPSSGIFFKEHAEALVKSGIYQSYVKAAKRCVDSVKSWSHFKKRATKVQCVEVEYEDLVKDPEGTINSLIESLSLPLRGIPINVCKILRDVAAHEHHSNVTKPSSSTSIGKGRAHIPESEKPRVRRILNAEFVENGYEEL